MEIPIPACIKTWTIRKRYRCSRCTRRFTRISAQSINVVEVANGVRSTVFAHDSVAVKEVLCCNAIYRLLESCSVLIILVQNVAVNTCKQIPTNVREICGHSIGCATDTVAKFVVPNCPFFHTRGGEMGKKGKPKGLPCIISIFSNYNYRTICVFILNKSRCSLSHLSKIRLCISRILLLTVRVPNNLILYSFRPNILG